MFKFWEFSNFLENPHFLVFMHLVIYFLVHIFLFGRPRAEWNDVDDDDPQKQTCLRQVITDFQVGTLGGALINGATAFDNAFIRALLSLGQKIFFPPPAAQGRFLSGKRPYIRVVVVGADFGE